MAIGDSAGILFKIKADGSQAHAEIKQTEREIHGLGLSFGEMAGASAIGEAAGQALGASIRYIGQMAIATISGLANLTVAASEYGSAIFDAQEKTGLAADTLAALKINAENAGSSLEATTASISKFAKLIGEAASGSEKAQAKLKELGVTSYDLDTALGQVTKTIVGAASGTAQITLAQKAFGKSGQELIPVLKQIGDLEEARREAREKGLALTEKEIRAADDFGDALGILKGQVTNLSSAFALQFAPVITDALNAVGRALANHQDLIRAAGQNFANVMRGMQMIAQSSTASMVISFASSVMRILSYVDLLQNGIFRVMRALNLLGAANKLPGSPQEASGSSISLTVPSGGGGKGGGGGGGGADTAEQQRKKAVDEAKKEMQEKLAIYRQTADEAAKIFEAQLAANKISEFEYLKEIRALKEREAKYEATLNLNFSRNPNLNAKERGEAGTDVRISQSKVRIEELNTQIAINKEYNKANGELIKQIEFQEQCKREEQERLRIIKEQRQEKQLQYDMDRRNRRQERDPYGVGSSQKGANGDLDWDVSGSGDLLTGIVDSLGAAKDQLPAMQQLGGMLVQTFGQVAQAVGQAVKSFILFGTAGGSFKKFAVEVIASLAQMAVVQAIFEAAQGLAMLALSWFTGNPKYAASAGAHFEAAAMFGIVGAVATAAGRAAAGGSFSQATGGSATGSGGDAAGDNAPLNFSSGFSGFGQRQAQEAAMMREVVGGVRDELEMFRQKFGPVTPGHVVMAGAGEAAEHIVKATNEHFSNDLRASSDQLRVTGRYD